jgi:hypothetical protein
LPMVSIAISIRSEEKPTSDRVSSSGNDLSVAEVLRQMIHAKKRAGR